MSPSAAEARLPIDSRKRIRAKINVKTASKFNNKEALTAPVR
jgi:hypothetical protein